jgi:hypothetical protein
LSIFFEKAFVKRSVDLYSALPGSQEARQGRDRIDRRHAAICAGAAIRLAAPQAPG